MKKYNIDIEGAKEYDPSIEPKYKESSKTNKIEIDTTSFQKAKTRKRVWVKPTATRKGYYREQEVGRESPRRDTGKIASLPDDIKEEILDLRRLGDSGAKIKEIIEERIEHVTESVTLSPSNKQKLDDIDTQISGITQNLRSEFDPVKTKDMKIKRAELLEEGKKLAPIKEVTYISGKSTGRNFVEEGLIDKDGNLKVTGQALTDWAAKRGVESPKKRKTAKVVATEAKVSEEKQFKEANERLARLHTENQTLKDELARERDSHQASDMIRDKLRNENFILREKLKGLNKPVEEGDNKKLVQQYMAGMEHASRHLKSTKMEKPASGKMQIEIDLSKVERGLREEKVKVVRGGKTFYRKQRVGQKEVDGEEKSKKPLAIVGLNKPEKESESESDFASGLKKGMVINFKGENKEIKFYNPSVKTVTFSDDPINYSFNEINKFGVMPGEKPKMEEKKPEPKVEEKPKKFIKLSPSKSILLKSEVKSVKDATKMVEGAGWIWDKKSDIFPNVKDYDSHTPIKAYTNDKGEIYGMSQHSAESFFEGEPAIGAIDYLEINTPMRGKGYGKKLMANILKDLLDQNCTEVRLTSLDSNSNKFYEAIGMEPIEGDSYTGDIKWMKKFVKENN